MPELSEKTAKELLKKMFDAEKIPHKKHRYELEKYILLTLFLGAAIPAAILFPTLPVALKPIVKNLSKKYKTKPREFVKSIKSLKRENLISIREIDDKQEITISKNGNKRILLYSLDYFKLPKREKWDGKWRIIIFDIPNKYNRARQALTQTLINAGCYCLQKSVYIFPYECKDEIDFISAMFEVYEYVIYIEANRIEIDKPIKRQFKL